MERPLHDPISYPARYPTKFKQCEYLVELQCVVGVREVAVERIVLRDACGSGSREREDGEIV